MRTFEVERREAQRTAVALHLGLEREGHAVHPHGLARHPGRPQARVERPTGAERTRDTDGRRREAEPCREVAQVRALVEHERKTSRGRRPAAPPCLDVGFSVGEREVVGSDRP